MISRRTWAALSFSAAIAKEPATVETGVDVRTPDGVCDATLFHPPKGKQPGVLIWHDSPGVRPAMRTLAQRIASQGYCVLLPNLFYRMAKTPVFDVTFDYAKNPSDREKYSRIVKPFVEPGAAERDAVAYVQFLDEQKQADRRRKVGTHGYCLGGPYVLKTAAAVPDRIGAGASFHGGFLVTSKPDSPHLLADKIKAPLYIAIASDDDAREPDSKSKLQSAFHNQAEIEVFPNSKHGWCVPDSSASNPVDAARAWSKLLELYRRL